METIRRFKSSGGSGAVIWFSQRITGLLLACLLVGHFVFQHFFAEDRRVGRLTYESVSATLVDPLWKTLEMLFLVCALFHGFNGLWMILSDYVHTGWIRVSLLTCLCVGGLVLFVLGTVTILPFSRPAG
jgi:succinate dehydrogenase / fumarate reductase membrane anchor subunit